MIRLAENVQVPPWKEHSTLHPSQGQMLLGPTLDHRSKGLSFLIYSTVRLISWLLYCTPYHTSDKSTESTQQQTHCVVDRTVELVFKTHTKQHMTYIHTHMLRKSQSNSSMWGSLTLASVVRHTMYVPSTQERDSSASQLLEDQDLINLQWWIEHYCVIQELIKPMKQAREHVHVSNINSMVVDFKFSNIHIR